MANEFKNGDSVRVVRLYLSDQDNGLAVGMVGVVKSQRKTGETCHVAFEGFTPLTNTHVDSEGYIMRHDQMELVKEDAPPFKVGDRVEYTYRFSGTHAEMIGFRGTFANEGGCFLPEGCRVDWDNGHALTGVFKGNLRKLEAWEVAMEAGEFYVRAGKNEYRVFRGDGDTWSMAHESGHTVKNNARTDQAYRFFREGSWVLIDPPPKPDPVAEAAAAYKAAAADRIEAEKAHQAASEALHQADARYSEAFHAQRKAEAKLLEVSAGLT